jgi:excisionase family DNA binding protein
MSGADWIADTVASLAPLTTASEAAAALRTSPRNLRRMIADGRICAVRAKETGSSRVLIARVEIARYLRGLETP